MGFWGWLWGRRPSNGTGSPRRGEFALARAREVAERHGWVVLEQDEQVLHETVADLAGFGFFPAFLPDVAYVAWNLGGDLPAFRRAPHRTLLKLRAMESEPLFSRVLLPDPEGVQDADSYVDLLWEAAAVAGTSEYLSGINWGMDFRGAERGFLNYTFAQRRHSLDIVIDVDHWDETALRQIVTSITPSAFDLIFDGTAMFCWVPVKRAAALLALLRPGT